MSMKNYIDVAILYLLKANILVTLKKSIKMFIKHDGNSKRNLQIDIYSFKHRKNLPGLHIRCHI